MEPIFRTATQNDYSTVLHIFTKAVKKMISQNIDQWDEQYPNGEILKTDIEKKQMFILAQHNAILSVIVINEECDEQYQSALWKDTNGKFAVIHRLCVNPDFQKKGIGKETLLLAEAELISKGYSSIRLDAFSLNPYALKMYQNLGYSKTGDAVFRKGLFYLFEKSLHKEN